MAFSHRTQKLLKTRLLFLFRLELNRNKSFFLLAATIVICHD